MRRAPALILGYHRVADRARDPHALCVKPERFAAQLAELSRVADVVPLAEITRPSRRPQVALTFDDGYRDNLTAAYPLLHRAEASATFFITTGMLDQPHEFWWDRLERLLLAEDVSATQLDVTVAETTLWLDARTSTARKRAHWALHQRLLGCPPEIVDRVLDQVAEQLGLQAEARQENLPLTSAQLGSLAAAEGTEIGAHTVTHARLADLSTARQRSEIAGSRQALEARIGHRVRSFAYPFGGPDALDDVTTRLVAAEGLARGCTTMEGPVMRRADPFLLPRCTVRDWDAAEFGRRIGRWLQG